MLLLIPLAWFAWYSTITWGRQPLEAGSGACLEILVRVTVLPTGGGASWMRRHEMLQASSQPFYLFYTSEHLILHLILYIDLYLLAGEHPILDVHRERLRIPTLPQSCGSASTVKPARPTATDIQPLR